MNCELVKSINKHLKEGNYVAMIQAWEDYKKNNLEYENDAYIFRVVFTNACLYGQTLCAMWLYNNIYLKMDIVTRVGLRHTFNYCCSQSRWNKNKADLTMWLEEIILENKNIGKI